MQCILHIFRKSTPFVLPHAKNCDSTPLDAGFLRLTPGFANAEAAERAFDERQEGGGPTA